MLLILGDPKDHINILCKLLYVSDFLLQFEVKGHSKNDTTSYTTCAPVSLLGDVSSWKLHSKSSGYPQNLTKMGVPHKHQTFIIACAYTISTL